jgi:hypothetical protein
MEIETIAAGSAIDWKAIIQFSVGSLSALGGALGSQFFIAKRIAKEKNRDLLVLKTEELCKTVNICLETIMKKFQKSGIRTDDFTEKLTSDAMNLSKILELGAIQSIYFPSLASEFNNYKNSFVNILEAIGSIEISTAKGMKDHDKTKLLEEYDKHQDILVRDSNDLTRKAISILHKELNLKNL